MGMAMVGGYNVFPDSRTHWIYDSWKQWNRGSIVTPKNVRPIEYGWRQYAGYKVWLRNLTSPDFVTVNNIPVMNYVWGRQSNK